MWRRAVWCWPLFFAVPLALVVVIDANRSATSQAQWLRDSATVLFSYAFFYFALSWPVWLTQLSWVKQLVVSALVPVGVLLILAVLPLNRTMDLAALQSPTFSFMYWFTPGAAINELLDGAVVGSPCELSMWEARQKTFHPSIKDLTFLPDGRILILGRVSKIRGGLKATKLVRLLPDGSIDPAFKGHAGCIQNNDGLFLPQADGRLLISNKWSLDSSPYEPTKLALVISPEGVQEREAYVPRLSNEKLVSGQLMDLRLEPDGGFMAYGTFTAKNNREFKTIRLRFNAAGEPDLSSPLEVPGLESSAEAITRDADGRLFISHHNSQQKQPVLFALTADGQPDEAFQTRLLETQRAHGLLRIHAMAVQPDGKLVAVAEKRPYEYVLVRLQRDGSLDSAFAQTSLSRRTNHVSVLADGNILVARVYNSDTASDSGDLMRLGPDGRVDEAITQRLRESFAAQQVRAFSALAVKPEGTVLLSNAWTYGPGRKPVPVLVQLRPDGSVDSGFRPPF